MSITIKREVDTTLRVDSTPSNGQDALNITGLTPQAEVRDRRGEVLAYVPIVVLENNPASFEVQFSSSLTDLDTGALARFESGTLRLNLSGGDSVTNLKDIPLFVERN